MLQKPRQPKKLSKKEKQKREAMIQKGIEFKDRLEAKAQKVEEKRILEKKFRHVK